MSCHEKSIRGGGDTPNQYPSLNTIIPRSGCANSLVNAPVNSDCLADRECGAQLPRTRWDVATRSTFLCQKPRYHDARRCTVSQLGPFGHSQIRRKLTVNCVFASRLNEKARVGMPTSLEPKRRTLKIILIWRSALRAGIRQYGINGNRLFRRYFVAFSPFSSLKQTLTPYAKKWVLPKNLHFNLIVSKPASDKLGRYLH